jgi:DNA-binding MarR family transcriptional regulator
VTQSRSDDATLPKLADFLCFAVYSANLAFGRAYRPILDKLGITYTQWITIVALWDDDNQTVKGLGEKLFLESNTLTPILKRLEELGYLDRRRDPADERQVIVSLTEAGRRLRQQGGQRDLIAATGLEPEEFATLQKAIVKMRNSLLQHTQDRPDRAEPAKRTAAAR